MSTYVSEAYSLRPKTLSLIIMLYAVCGWVGGWTKWKYNHLSPQLGWVGAWDELGNIKKS